MSVYYISEGDSQSIVGGAKVNYLITFGLEMGNGAANGDSLKTGFVHYNSNSFTIVNLTSEVNISS